LRTTRIYFNKRITAGETLALPARASNHLVRVLRCKKGSSVTVFNGEGGEFSATLLNEDPRAANVIINSFVDTNRESPLKIRLIQGLSRSEHMDTTIQKATELGVTEIIPVICERSANINRERAGKKHERWNQITISACEQSGRNLLPVIHQTLSFEKAIKKCSTDKRLVLDPVAENSLNNIKPDIASICILSGPEGGLSELEINTAADAGYHRIKFGPRILRTETAGPAVISALQTLWGDMG
jgi:16S rRNA (uracil1498-N3)-methyltransferase